MDLLSLHVRVYDVLDNCQQLVNLVYKWCELREDSDVWERLYEDMKKSAIN